MTKLKALLAFADYKMNVTQILDFDYGWEKHCGKRRKCRLLAFFFFFPQCFQKRPLLGGKSRNCELKVSWINPLPDDNILDWSKLKQITEDILTRSQTMIPFDASGKQAI